MGEDGDLGRKTNRWASIAWPAFGVVLLVGLILAVNLLEDESDTTAESPPRPATTLARSTEPPAPRKPPVTLDLRSCGSEEVIGRVVNNTSGRLDVFVEVLFLDDDLQVGDSIASVAGLQPGREAEWVAPVLGYTYTNCEARVSGTYPSD